MVGAELAEVVFSPTALPHEGKIVASLDAAENGSDNIEIRSLIREHVRWNFSGLKIDGIERH